MARSDVWFLVIVGTGLGFICGLAWADFDHPNHWVETYQGLIAGILAVAAGVGTVNAMRASEERQEDRHKQLMNVGESAKRLKLERAKIFGSIILGLCDDLEAAHRKLEEDESQDDLAFDVIRVWSTVATFVEVNAIQDAKEYFSSNATARYVMVEKMCDLAKQMKQKAFVGKNIKFSGDKRTITIGNITKLSPRVSTLREFAEEVVKLQGAH